MCGLAGFLTGTAEAAGDAPRLLRRMGDVIGHRGPDDHGEWWDPSAGIGFAHRRLSIVDLSAAGHQPMTSTCGRFTIAYNGEIYNHMDLRRRLTQEGKAPAWRGHSDTETLLAAIAAWGPRRAVRECKGMFAFALWDAQDRQLILARDRVGEKPLYYGWQGGVFLFGSELKALRAHPAFAGEIDRGALTLFFRGNYIPAPHSIYANVRKVPPGSLAFVSLASPEPVIESYWDGLDAARRGEAEPFAGSPADAVDALDAVLGQAVSRQLMGDVPLGAFLSGGVDSSAVVALMQAQSSRPVQTFSIGFDIADYNEAEFAGAVASHLHTEHTELYITTRQAEDVIPNLASIYDEPFADSSQIPTVLVSQLARRHVSVTLSGDGGDELFCGYNRYLLADRLWRGSAVAPAAARRAAARAIKVLSPDVWNGVGRLFPRRWAPPALGDKLHKFADVLGVANSEELYYALASYWRDPRDLVIGGTEPVTALVSALHNLKDMNDIHRMMAVDLVSYLPDDNLVKVDRATMSVSLESRMPFLDVDVMELAWSLPLDYKLRGGVTKWALRQLLYRHVPPRLIERPKMGFGVPIDRWLRTGLRDWANDLLNEDRIRQQGYLNADVVGRLWREHLSERRNWQYRLWGILMFQSWLEHQTAPPL